MARAFVFIDGSNFYFKLKELSSTLKGKFQLLTFGLTKASDNTILIRPEDIQAFLPPALL